MILKIEDFALVSDKELAIIRQELEEVGFVGLGIVSDKPPVSEKDVDDWVKGLRAKYGGKKISAIHGIIKHYGIGQAPFMWAARDWLHSFFKLFWDSDDLLCSLDGANYDEYNPRSRVRPYDWLHRDQRPEYSDFRMVQGVLNLNQAGGLVVVPGSHKIEFPGIKTGKDWFKIPVESKSLRNVVELESPYPITFWLFDSRTWHANYPPKNPGEIRRACYVTFGKKPENWNPARQKKRERLIESGETTSHWPHKLAKNSAPRFYHQGEEYVPGDAKGDMLSYQGAKFYYKLN